MPDPATAKQVRPNRVGLLLIVGAVFGMSWLSFAGCAKGGKTATFGSDENLLGYGEYSARAVSASGHLTRIKLNQNNTYIRKRFLGPCQVSESKGDWKADNEVIEFRLQETRQRPDCQTEQWVTEKSDKVTERNIRNITPNSFELLDQEESSSAEWVKFVKP